MNSKDGQRCKYRAAATERRRNGCRTYLITRERQAKGNEEGGRQSIVSRTSQTVYYKILLRGAREAMLTSCPSSLKYLFIIDYSRRASPEEATT